MPMEVVNYSYDSNVFLDKCPACGGVWTDEGEVERVARYLKGNPAVNRYTESLMAHVVKEREPGTISRLLRSRRASGTIALVYLGGAILTREFEVIWKMAMFFVWPVACIWFSDAIGGYTGLLSLPRPPISRRSPGIFIALTGWILLLLPVVVAVVMAVLQLC